MICEHHWMVQEGTTFHVNGNISFSPDVFCNHLNRLWWLHPRVSLLGPFCHVKSRPSPLHFVVFILGQHFKKSDKYHCKVSQILQQSALAVGTIGYYYWVLILDIEWNLENILYSWHFNFFVCIRIFNK